MKSHSYLTGPILAEVTIQEGNYLIDTVIDPSSTENLLPSDIKALIETREEMVF